ncbi:MAG: Na+/H+-dicarboxylate symporter [halophilic archaeon J07HX5]|jgi:Na+/H+-dicarboxylate symporters|nr:MAG: Na+/H+-dicarboxylate symporter [halophilic archaeon J07HX5]
MISATALNAVTTLWQRYRAVPIVYRIGAAFVLGSVVGLAAPNRAVQLKPLGDIFVRLLSMIVVPVIIFTLLMGIRRISPSTLSRIGWQVVGLYAILSSVAVAVGLAVANLINPGAGFDLDVDSQDAEKYQGADQPSLVDTLISAVPENPFNAMAEGNVLAIIFFVITLGLSLLLVQENTDDDRLQQSIESLFAAVEAITEALFKLVWGIMEYGVIGVFALMAAAFGNAGADALMPILMLSGTLLAAICFHIAVIYLGGLIFTVTRQSPTAFLTGAKDAIVTALSIRSSSGTLPVTMNNADKNLCIDESVYGFSLPLGATINMDGTAMYHGIVAVFAANIAGVSLGLDQQVAIVLTAVLASIGAAGVPGGGFILIAVVLQQAGLPVEVLAFIAGVDPILDRIRTMTNVTGDLAVTTTVANWNDAVDFTSGSWAGQAGDTSVGSNTPTEGD